MSLAVPCPCCGALLDAADPAALVHVVTPQGRRILERMLAGNGGPVASESLIDACYGHRPDGGPLNAKRVIQALICQNNARLRPYGWRIRGRLGRGSAGYVLQALAAVA